MNASGDVNGSMNSDMNGDMNEDMYEVINVLLAEILWMRDLAVVVMGNINNIPYLVLRIWNVRCHDVSRQACI